jgi:uncharacterized protein (DUF4415 family)
MLKATCGIMGSHLKTHEALSLTRSSLSTKTSMMAASSAIRLSAWWIPLFWSALFLWTAASQSLKSSALFRRERQTNMSATHTKTNSVKRLKISEETRQAYARRDKSRDNLDPDNPVMPPDAWDGASIGKYYRPRKTLISMRIDDEVLDWLKSQGEGHLTRINDILRERMEAERRSR